jgi:hypothetical protein
MRWGGASYCAAGEISAKISQADPVVGRTAAGAVVFSITGCSGAAVSVTLFRELQANDVMTRTTNIR